MVLSFEGLKELAEQMQSGYEITEEDKEKVVKYLKIKTKLESDIPIIDLKELTDAEETVAQFMDKFQPLYYDRANLWWLWDRQNKFYKVIDEVDLINSIRIRLGMKGMNESKKRNQYLYAFMDASRMREPATLKSKWIQFKNTIVDLSLYKENKITLEEAKPKYFLVNPLPFNFIDDPNIETPFFDKLFEDWVGKEWKETLYELIGYCMIPEFKIHSLFFLIGSGRNGKSSFTKIVRKILSEENYTSTTLNRLDPRVSRFETADFYKKLACIIDECDFNVLKDTSLLKMLTGESPIKGEFKNKGKLVFESYCKTIISTNSLPVTLDKTDGWYRRAFIIDFPNKFPEGKDILEEVPEGEWDKLVSRSLFSLMKLLQRGSFTNQGSVEDRTKRYEERSNPSLKFIEENYIKDPDGSVWLWEFEEGLEAFCKSKGFRRYTSKEVSEILENMGYERKKLHVYEKGYEGKVWNAIMGLRKKVSVQKDLVDKNVTPVTDVTISPLNSHIYKSSQTTSTSVTVITKNDEKQENSNETIHSKVYSIEDKFLNLFPKGSVEDLSLIESKAMLMGIDIDMIDKLLERFNREGIIYSPRSGQWGRV